MNLISEPRGQSQEILCWTKPTVKLQAQLADLQAVRPEYRIVIGMCTIASTDSNTKTITATATCMESSLMYSRHLALHTRHSLRLAMVTQQLTQVGYTVYFAQSMLQMQNHT